MKTLQGFWQLARPFWTSSEKIPALMLLLATILMNLGLVGVNILNNFWNLHFYNALQALDYDAFLIGGIEFILLQAALTGFTVAAFHFQQKLTIKWMRWEITNTLQNWLKNRRYLLMQLNGPETDNPDQRVADDIDMFIVISLKLGLGVMTALVSLFSFLNILWQASSLVSLPIGAEGLVIPGLLVWIALLYSIAGTGGAFWLGRALPRLNFLQQRREADFRFSLMRLREHAESIAQYRGEKAEMQTFTTRLEAALQNFWQLVKKQKIVLGYSTFYMRTATVIPMFIMAPQFFAGVFPLGRLTQISAAFGEVHEAMAYLVKAFPQIAEWKAVIDRLTGFQNRLNAISSDNGVKIRHQPRSLAISKLNLWLPDSGKTILRDFSVNIAPGESLLVRAPSGFGKSTMVRAVFGLWQHASGSAAYDTENALVLAQKPYFPLGNLRDILWYPQIANRTKDATLAHALQKFGLGHLASRLDQETDWSKKLSIGEQQRCAFVRVLLHKPQILFLDESTSALDEKSETLCYRLLKEELPETILVSIGHRPSLDRFHSQILDLDTSSPSAIAPQQALTVST
ncbi:ABC transporter ATP-binding protein/permease [Thalassospira marina]|uniref:ABC transporter ATP-binding protein n=1 Tax=Thalassospira marina TaxID=2048283 RepID=A0A2N3KZW1_9PROT|nr:ABC transporter ATP-binding protein/permease [Thalassospira marina]PKR56006.1 ABC transporter ATP-binding protein [Thalassospira marina]